MGLAGESVHPKVAARPWASLADKMEPEQGHYSDFAAWQRWLSWREGGIIADAAPIRDALDYDAEINLYVMMCELADGEGPEFPVPTGAPA